MVLCVLYSKKWSAYFVAEFGCDNDPFYVKEIVASSPDFYVLYYEMHNQTYCTILQLNMNPPLWLDFLENSDGWLLKPIVLDECKFLEFVMSEHNHQLTKRIKPKLLTKINGD